MGKPASFHYLDHSHEEKAAVADHAVQRRHSRVATAVALAPGLPVPLPSFFGGAVATVAVGAGADLSPVMEEEDVSTE